MCNFVIGVRDKESGHFMIKADQDGPVEQAVGRKTALKALKNAAKEHGITKVELFQLVEYEI